MQHLFRPARRLFLAPVLMLCLVLAMSVPAAAYTPPSENITGEIGHYDFRDYPHGSHGGNVECDYHTYSNGQHRIDEFVLRVPRIWWYDKDSSTTHEHGTVGWQYRIQESTDPDTVPFSTVYTSSVQKHTAHEDHPGFSDGDRAPFTTRHLDWSNGHTVYYRIKYTVNWYASNGSVQGQISHWYFVYDTDTGPSPVTDYCVNKWVL
jgi:hypothetical protein